MTDLIVCPSCRKITRHDDVHSCYDFDAVERVRDAERKVIAAAEAWAEEYRRVFDLHAEKEPSEAEKEYHLKRVGDTSDALEEAVRALTAARQGEP